MKLDFIQVGRIVNAHGIRGEVRLLPRGFDPAYLTGFDTFYIGGTKPPSAPRRTTSTRALSCSSSPAWTI